MLSRKRNLAEDMKVVPHAFYMHPGIEKILIDGNSCVIAKQVTQADTNNERYLAANALTLVLEGSLQIEDDQDHITTIHKNHFILLPKGMYAVTDLIPTNSTFQAVVFFFDDDICDEFLTHFETIPTQETQSTFILPYYDDLRLFTDTLLTLYRGKAMHQFTRPKLLELLHLISISKLGDSFVDAIRAIKNRERKSVREFMLKNYMKPLDIADYAYLTGRSISTFQRDFKSKFDLSPKKWLIEKRMEQACELLRKTSRSVTDISISVGYDNVSHFIKAFHKKYGNSPKQYQINSRKNSTI